MRPPDPAVKTGPDSTIAPDHFHQSAEARGNIALLPLEKKNDTSNDARDHPPTHVFVNLAFEYQVLQVTVCGENVLAATESVLRSSPDKSMLSTRGSVRQASHTRNTPGSPSLGFRIVVSHKKLTQKLLNPTLGLATSSHV